MNNKNDINTEKIIIKTKQNKTKQNKTKQNKNHHSKVIGNNYIVICYLL